MDHQLYFKIKGSFSKLKSYCESEDFKGWDPYDGLSSKLFKATLLKHWPLARLAWIQAFKLSPINLRKLFLVPKGYNAKGIGLFINGYCNLIKIAKQGNTSFGTAEEIEWKINYLSELLIPLKSMDYSGSCWGYNFDWQNRVFFQPVYTPTVVATSFCADALFNAFEITGNDLYLTEALSSADFVLNDLKRMKVTGGEMLSYSPLDKSQVYNAALLGARLLARCYQYTKNETYNQLASVIVNAVLQVQKEDGSWVYGVASNQAWIDSFHTGFNLECIFEYMEYTGDKAPLKSFEKGFAFYVENFFLEDGTPKYYHNKTYPLDIHSPAQFIATLVRTKKFSSYSEKAETVMNWTILNMQDKKGYFYYQLKKGVSSKIPYMRWAQAWMFYSFTYFLLEGSHQENGIYL